MFSIGVIAVVIAAIALFILSVCLWDRIRHNSYNSPLWEIISVIVMAIMIVVSICAFTAYKRTIVTSAIEHYQVGEYELVEDRINDITIRSYYKIIDVEHD